MDRCHDQRRRHCLLIINRYLGYDASDSLHLAGARIAASRAIRQLVALRIHLCFLDDLRLIQDVFVRRANLRFILWGTIQTVFGPFLLFALEVGFGRVANGVLSFHLHPFLSFFPYSYTRLASAKLFSFFSFMLKGFVW